MSVKAVFLKRWEKSANLKYFSAFERTGSTRFIFMPELLPNRQKVVFSLLWAFRLRKQPFHNWRNALFFFWSMPASSFLTRPFFTPFFASKKKSRIFGRPKCRLIATAQKFWAFFAHAAAALPINQSFLRVQRPTTDVVASILKQ